jgi:hypothetical protein
MNFKKFIFTTIFCFASLLIMLLIFKPIFTSDTIIFKFAIHPFNICKEQPILWNIIKFLFVFDYLFCNFIFFNSIFSKIFPKKIKEKINIQKNISDLNLIVGFDSSNNLIKIPEKSLYQNILITGTIGTGKTSSAMYPFTEQLIEYKSNIAEEKLGMLILDVKGNYYSKVSEFAEKYKRENDLIIIDLSGNIKYNPLDKPLLKPSVLADRLKTILLLFSPNNSEDFWLDKISQILTEAIKLCRLYNDNYVTFEELHNLVFFKDYYLEKVAILKKLFIENKFSKEDIYNLLSSLNFFEKEYFSLDDRTISILKSEISRITTLFISDYNIKNTFCPKKEEINFFGFSDVIENGKIVVLNMNIANYKNLSKLIAAYLKLDFQTEVISRLNNPDFNSSNNHFNIFSSVSNRPVCFISDEYQEYVTLSDSEFFAQSREAKCINIVSTQSYTSLLNTLNKEASVKVIIQNLVNKLWFRNDDIFTIEEAQKQIGKEDKKKISKTISENAKETNYNYFFNNFLSKDSNLSESINSYYQTDYIFDTNFFTRNLEIFSCLAFLSNGTDIIEPQKLKLIPYFKKKSLFP